MTTLKTLQEQMDSLCLGLLHEGFTLTLMKPTHIVVEKDQSFISISIQHEELREVASETQFTIHHRDGSLRMSTYTSAKRPTLRYPSPVFRKKVVQVITKLFPHKEETRHAIRQQRQYQ